MEAFRDEKGNISMARVVVFMSALAGTYCTAFIPFSDNVEQCVYGAIGLFTIAAGGKALNKKMEKK